MRKLIIFAALTIFLSCEKDDFSIENPDVRQFVELLKSGKYDKYEFGANGDKLWTKMPVFVKEQIPLLIDLSQDTTFVSPFDHFPVNPVSSIPPYRMNNEVECIMIGEYLLWCVEAIINGNTYASLTPAIKNQNYNADQRLTGKEMLEVRELYNSWWEEYSKTGIVNKLPLEGTDYFWR